MPIQRLTESVVSMIAAGEVIERPASAIKELLENALDSGAQNIYVNLNKEPATLFEVRDDGCGIPADELALAVQPHATSKLVLAEDLETITTLGFRGEALAAISSLSNLTLRSRCQTDDQGHELKLQGTWSEEKTRPCVMDYGTEVCVQDLFARIPVRRKFLRKPATEWAHCESVVRALAIGNPSVSFTLARDGKARLTLPAVQDPDKRIASVLGEKFAATAHPVFAESGPLRLRGMLSFTGVATADRQFWYLNGRSISDRLLRHAVRKAFMDVAREPNIPYALFLEMPAQMIDVNAHPAKLEVRFRESHAVFGFVHGALTKIANEPVGINPDIDIASTLPPWQVAPEPGSYQWPNPAAHAAARAAPGGQAGAHSSASPLQQLQDMFAQPPQSEEALVPDSLGTPIGVLHGLFLLAENSEGLVVIDIHAAHERILYEQFKQQAGRRKVSVQPLISAIDLELSPPALDAVAEYRSKLHKLGLHIDNKSGVEQLAAIPAYLAGHVEAPEKLAVEAIEEIVATGTAFTPVQLRDQLLATAACHAAIRGANAHLQHQDLDALLRKMEKTLSSGRCNHGRLTWRLLRLKELDRFFERHK